MPKFISYFVLGSVLLGFLACAIEIPFIAWIGRGMPRSHVLLTLLPIAGGLGCSFLALRRVAPSLLLSQRYLRLFLTIAVLALASAGFALKR